MYPVPRIHLRRFITSSNQAKIKYLNVKPETLRQYGAVASKTAREMAVRAINASGCDVSIAVTGIAGPGGGSDDKPVGCIFVLPGGKKSL